MEQTEVGYYLLSQKGRRLTMFRVMLPKPNRYGYDTNSKKIFECPFCKKIDDFWSVSPARCTHCGRRLPDIDGILEKEEKRIAWHLMQNEDKSIMP